MNYPHIFERLSDPSEAPPKVGIHWINKLSNKHWFSTGTSSVNDWKLAIDSASYNLDGGMANTEFGGTTLVDAGGA
jgi:hypothetical protein